MTALARLQAEFRAWMQQAPVVPGGLRSGDNAPVLAVQSAAIRARVCDTTRATRDVLLDVYRQAYALRLIEALQTDYPGVHAMAGPVGFDAMARGYVRVHPSRHASVRWFGREFAAFLATTAPFSESPALADMARFEWAMGEAFDAEDAVPLTFGDLAGLPADAWNALHLEFVPSLRRLALRYEAPQAWLRRDDVEPGALEVLPSPAAPPGVDWLLWRSAPDGETQFRSMDADEAWMIDGARAGTAFPALCDGLAAFAPRGATADDTDATALWAAERAAGLLRAWVDAGMVAGTEHD
jgi:hypothetical protein